MIFKYVIKNFRRRKVRTVLMVLSLIISTGLIVAMSATLPRNVQSPDANHAETPHNPTSPASRPTDGREQNPRTPARTIRT